MRDRIQQILSLLDVDRAVFYALSLRAWQFIAGPVTALLVASYFSPNVQGYFYTFASLLALQSFLELGFHVVIMNVSSHEWAKLSLDESGAIVGDHDARSRLVSFGRVIAKWYGVVCVLFLGIVLSLGVAFFYDSPLPIGEWLMPWSCLVALTGMSLWALPFHAVLEGCNQVAEVNRFRFLQALTGNAVVWVCIPLGAELWTCVAIASVKVAWEIFLLGWRYGRFFKTFLHRPQGPVIDWRNTVWPLQWRLGVQGVFSYFAYWLFTPIMFEYHSPAMAGRMGMTWTVLAALQAGALAWVQTRAPRFGMLISEGRYDELDRLYRRLTAISLAIVTAGGLAFWGVVYALHAAQHSLAERVLPPDALALFTLAIVLYHVPHCQAFYVRAHKREMLLWAGVISSVAIGLLVWQLGGRYGPIGAAAGYLAVVALFVLPYQTIIWRRCRKLQTSAG